MHPITHPHEPASNAHRAGVAASEPRSLRTFTPTQAVLAHSGGVYHWTADGRRLFDFTSGVLVANLGHNPPDWLRRFQELMGWTTDAAVPLTAYNAITPVEDAATRMLLDRPDVAIRIGEELRRHAAIGGGTAGAGILAGIVGQ